MIIDQFREYSASAEYLRIRARREIEAATKSSSAVDVINGFKRAKTLSVKAFRLENKERKVAK